MLTVTRRFLNLCRFCSMQNLPHIVEGLPIHRPAALTCPTESCPNTQTGSAPFPRLVDSIPLRTLISRFTVKSPARIPHGHATELASSNHTHHCSGSPPDNCAYSRTKPYCCLRCLRRTLCHFDRTGNSPSRFDLCKSEMRGRQCVTVVSYP